MKNLRLSIALLAVPLLVVACPEPREPTIPEEPFEEEERPVVPEEEEVELTEQQRMERQSYIDRVDDEISQLEDQIDRLEERLEDAPEQVRTDVQPRIDALRGYLDNTKTRYENWDEMTELGFRETRFQVDDRIQEARQTYQEISERVDEAIIAPAAG